MSKIAKMQIADWLSYPLPLYINNGFGLGFGLVIFTRSFENLAFKIVIFKNLKIISRVDFLEKAYLSLKIIFFSELSQFLAIKYILNANFRKTVSE